MKSEIIKVQGTEVTVASFSDEKYISLTDIARYRPDKDPSTTISLWIRAYSAIEYLGLWETLYNPDFKPLEFEGFKERSGDPQFWLSPSAWIRATNAIGIKTKAGRYGGGTFAHPDIAFKFASWVSAEFELYLVSEFQRLKAAELQQQSSEWSLQRMLTKINYQIHTDAVQEYIIPPEITKEQARFVYASEADVLNVALFGKTASQWRKENPKTKSRESMRDYATILQLIVLSNIEGLNAELIRDGMPQGERLVRLNKTAIAQLTSLSNNHHVKRLADG